MGDKMKRFGPNKPVTPQYYCHRYLLDRPIDVTSSDTIKFTFYVNGSITAEIIAQGNEWSKDEKEGQEIDGRSK
jgi:hypothetical protein